MTINKTVSFWGTWGGAFAAITAVAGFFSYYLDVNVSKFVTTTGHAAFDQSLYMTSVAKVIMFSICIVVFSLIAFFLLDTMNFRKNPVSQPTNITGEEYPKLNQSYHTMVLENSSFLEKIYSNTQIEPRLFIEKSIVNIHIFNDGSAKEESEVSLLCTNGSVHYWKYWVEYDDPIDQKLFYENFSLEVKDQTSGTALTFIRCMDGPQKKEFAIGFSELKKDETLELNVKATIPNYFSKLINENIADYYWKYETHPSGRVANNTYRFIFEKSIGDIHAELVGNVPAPANTLLNRTDDQNHIIWTYHNSNESDQTKIRRLRFILA